MQTSKCGRVILVGAGPGDPSLITLRGRECLQQAEVVIHDFLLNPALLAYAPNAEIINAAGPTERRPRPMEQIIALMIEKARQGKRVVRLKGGDPLVFGRGGEEALALAEAGIPFEIVPGVTSATAVPTYAGIPITQRGVASSLAVIAGHNLENAEALDWPCLAHGADTLLFLMGIQQLPYIVDHLLAAGRAPHTPIAIVEQGTHPGQKTVTGTLGDIVPRAASIRPPATIIVGEVVRMRERLRWFDRPDLNPLFGLHLLTIHSGREALAAELNRQLTAHGAEARSFAAQSVGPAPDPGRVAGALRGLTAGRPPWEDLVFGDARAVEYFFEALFACGGDARALSGLRLGARDPATVEALRAFGLRADWVSQESLAGRRVLLATGAGPESTLPASLEAQGAKVETIAVYAQLTAPSLQPFFDWLHEETLPERRRGVIFTDPLVVEGMARLAEQAGPARGAALAQLLVPVAVVCAGPETAEAAAALSMRIDGVAAELTAEAVAEALRAYSARSAA
jgi:uroporphyrinogen III methyltransferase/synthase